MSNYKALLDQVRRYPKVCFVTFNYDTLLEEALLDLAPPIERMLGYIRGPFQVFKPHGSIDWERFVDIDIPPESNRFQDIINAAPSHRPSDHWRKKGEQFGQSLPQAQWMPTIAIPVASKAQFVLPKDHADAMIESIKEVNKVLIVGWRAAEHAFLQSLAQNLQSPVQVLAVCGSESAANETLEKLRAAGIRLNGKADPRGASLILLEAAGSSHSSLRTR